jgi:GGDEF domain-containing protein
MSISRFPAHLRLIGAPSFDSSAPAKAVAPDVELDPVTGVATRNALLDRLEDMGRLAPTAPLSFVVVKVAGLKVAEGEATLRAVAARVQELTRATDIVGRLTGTTFGVALQGTGVTAAGAVAARLTHHLNRIAELHPAVCITVSAATGVGLNAETLPVAAMDSYEPCCG